MPRQWQQRGPAGDNPCNPLRGAGKRLFCCLRSGRRARDERQLYPPGAARCCCLLSFPTIHSQISKPHRIAPNIHLALNSSCSDQTWRFLQCVLKKDKSLPQLKPSTFLPSHRIGGRKAPRADEETSGPSVCSVLFLVFISCSSCCYFRCKAERKPYLLIQG